MDKRKLIALMLATVLGAILGVYHVFFEEGHPLHITIISGIIALLIGIALAFLLYRIFPKKEKD